MKCPHCGNRESGVIDTQLLKSNKINRRRKCLSCKQRFTTYETIEETFDIEEALLKQEVKKAISRLNLRLKRKGGLLLES